MMLSPHFSLSELTYSDWATRHGNDNIPSTEVIANLKKVAATLEQVREILGKPIHINSGYRNSTVNKGIGGSKNSKHMQGLAVDFICPEFGNPYSICKVINESDIKFDQLILEFYSPETHDAAGRGWVHLGLAGKDSRQQVLSINKHGTHTGLHV